MFSFINGLVMVTMVLVWAAMAYIAYKIIRWIVSKFTSKGESKCIDKGETTTDAVAKSKKNKSCWLHGWRRHVLTGSCVLVFFLLGPVFGVASFLLILGFMFWCDSA